MTTAVGDGERPPQSARVGAEPLEGCGQAVAGLPAEIAACATGVDLTGLSESEARLALAGQTARFAALFLRWIDSRAYHGMSYVRLRLLQTLHCRGPAIMRDLGSELGASPRNMTAMVDALQDAHLVVRRPHPTDRRATLVELSTEGAQAAEHSLGAQLDAMASIFTGLTAAEREQFSAAMTKLMSAMKDDDQAC